MNKPTLPSSGPSQRSRKGSSQLDKTSKQRRQKLAKSSESSDVLISAVISSYLLTHLHHVLQRAEYGAVKEGRSSLAANFGQLRKVLCMDARSMEDAFASGFRDGEIEKIYSQKMGSKVA